MAQIGEPKGLGKAQRATDPTTPMPIAPERELGRGVSSNFDFVGVAPWGLWIDDVERAPDLRWPHSIMVYDQMANDAQCQGLYLGMTAAIQRYIWYIDQNDCSARFTKMLAADLNLPIGAEAAKKQASEGKKRGILSYQRRSGWYPHLRLALKALQYGHYYFEQVGAVIDGVWRLQKLGPRHPRTVTEIWISREGNLLLIKQGYGEPTPGIPYTGAPEIPIDRLVAYVWDQEPGNWVGRSIFRPMYRNYLVKDRLLRVDAIKHERNGVGMPIVSAPEGATKADIIELDKMAQEYKAGERGGGALPFGSKLTLQGTQGTLPDTLASLRFHNEEMARSVLMMFMQLGQTATGSRSLGESFIDWFEVQQEMIADWVCDHAVPYIIGDWWAWNVDENAEQTPLLGYLKEEDAQASANDFGPAKDTLPADVKAAFSAHSHGAGRRFQSPPPRADDPSPSADGPAAEGGGRRVDPATPLPAQSQGAAAGPSDLITDPTPEEGA